ncbi:hypothetical protein AFLA_004344 [Aspergillus flavus NRRL3357]|nr:hypothetical protein AFLA_004344 [Aspergillus flavus NRRL3357]
MLLQLDLTPFTVELVIERSVCIISAVYKKPFIHRRANWLVPVLPFHIPEYLNKLAIKHRFLGLDARLAVTVRVAPCPLPEGFNLAPAAKDFNWLSDSLSPFQYSGLSSLHWSLIFPTNSAH